MALTVALAGQILIHEPLDLTAPGSGVVRAFLSADVALANLEATVKTDGAWPTKTKTLHLAAPEALGSVRDLGFHVVTHANNHAFDLGPPGIAATGAAAQAHGLLLAGSGADIDAATAPAVMSTENGSLAIFAVDLGPQPDIVYASTDRAGIAPLRMRRTVSVPPNEYQALQRIVRQLGDDRREAARKAVGYRRETAGGIEVFGTVVTMAETIAATWVPEENDLRRLLAGMDRAQKAGHLIGVALHNHHWDPDWTRTPEWLVDLGRRLIDEGASFVAGTGAPVAQPVAFHRSRPILPGLGNLVFHTRRPKTYDEQGVDVWRSAAARLRFDGNGDCLSLDMLPIAVGRPRMGESRPTGPVALAGPVAVNVAANGRA